MKTKEISDKCLHEFEDDIENITADNVKFSHSRAFFKIRKCVKCGLSKKVGLIVE